MSAEAAPTPVSGAFVARVGGVDLPLVSPPPAAYAWQAPPPRTAGFGRRAAALAVDAGVVFLAAWIAVAVAASAGLLRVPDCEIGGAQNDETGVLCLAGIVEAPILLAYGTLQEGFGGRTLGKLLLGLRVRRADGARVTMGDAFVRNLLRELWVTPVGPVFLVLDWWALQSTELDQRLGDLAVDSVVLDESGG